MNINSKIIRCSNCETPFSVLTREYNRQIKRGRENFFCSRKCAAIKNNQNNPRKGNPANLVAGNRRDEYTPFRWFVLRAQYRNRKKKYGCDVNVEYLKNIWDSQKGKCPITGWDLILPQDTKDGWAEYKPINASLDRIDNSKGYIEGNVRFIAVMANLARQSFTDEQLIEFCKAVVINQ